MQIGVPSVRRDIQSGHFQTHIHYLYCFGLSRENLASTNPGFCCSSQHILSLLYVQWLALLEDTQEAWLLNGVFRKKWAMEACGESS